MTNLIFLKMDKGHFPFSDPPCRALLLSDYFCIYVMFNLESGIDFDHYLILPVHHIILFAIEKKTPQKWLSFRKNPTKKL